METIESGNQGQEKVNVASDHLKRVANYFSRIKYVGDATPSLKTLQEIQRLHPSSIPFENLNPFLRIPVLLDLKSLENKILKEGRGGYCFEQNLLLMDVLKTIGFKVRGLAARVLWNVPEGVTTARGHMLLLVEVDGENFISDVGFGGLTLTSALKLTTGAIQKTPHGDFRLVFESDEFILQANIKDEWKSMYKFNLQEQLLPDYEVSNWYLSNHPTSHFVTGLIAAKTNAAARYALRGNELAIHYLNGETERRKIESAEELKTELENTFGLNLDKLKGVEEALGKVIQPV